MKTKSKIIEIEFKLKGRPRNYIGLDLESDGIIVKSIRMKELLPEISHLKFNLFQFLDEKEREIRLYLPVSIELDLISLSAEGKPLKKPETKILFLGDSITQGMDCVSPVCTYTTIAARILGADYINQGVGGFVLMLNPLMKTFLLNLILSLLLMG